MNEQEIVDFIAKKAVLWSIIYGAQGFGKNLPAKEKLMQKYWDSVPRSIDNGRLGVGTLQAKPRTTLPQKVCKYGKPKVYWFGELHGSNNFIWNDGYTMSRHWDISSNKLTVRGMDPSRNMSVFVGDTIETKTYSTRAESWKPQGQLFVTSGKPLKINDREKEMIARVERIEFPEG